MKYIGNIQSQANAEVYAVATGALPDGKPVIVNSDGTVSVVAETSITEASGTPVSYGGSNYSYPVQTYDSNSNKSVVFSNQNGTLSCRVGTVDPSNNSISFGTAATVATGVGYARGCTFDTLNNKVIIVYTATNIYAAVGTVSGTDISFGSAVLIDGNAGNASYNCTFDSNSNKVVVAFKDTSNSNYGTLVVGTVSGTGISFGSNETFEEASVDNIQMTFDSANNKVVVGYSDGGNSNYATAVVATVSGTSISAGTPVIFNSATYRESGVDFDTQTGKVVISYRDSGNSNYGTAIVGTVSGTGISFGNEAVFNSSGTNDTTVACQGDGTAVVFYNKFGDGNKGAVSVGTISGTGISFGSEFIVVPSVESSGAFQGNILYDDNANRFIIVCYVYINAGDAYGIVYRKSDSVTNLTSENFLGFTGGEVDYTTLTQASGTPVAYEPDSVEWQGTAYDSNSNRVVVAYVDTGDSNKGKAVVGAVNAANNSISFGTPVVFESSDQPRYCSATFDSNSNKVIILYSDGGNSSYGTALVGTVDSSDNSISFGSEVVFESAAVDEMSATFDSNANKVVIAYRDKGNSNRGTAIVGTVSGTSISFGTAVVFLSEDSRNNAISFDSTANKVVIAYADNSSTYRGTAIVGTVSGTGISFGSQAVFANASTVSIGCTYDSNSNKTVIAYADAQEDGTAIVATVSDTSISFGTAVEFDGDASLQNKIVFDSNVNKVVNMYRDGGNSNRPTMIVGTVSGTSISFETAVTLSNSGSNYYASVFDTTSKKVIAFYSDDTNTAGTAAVFQAAGLVVTRPEIADGKTATIQVGGSINTQQNALTAGQQYFVQADGTLGTTAASPSVIAGTAVSATDLIVKG